MSSRSLYDSLGVHHILDEIKGYALSVEACHVLDTRKWLRSTRHIMRNQQIVYECMEVIRRSGINHPLAHPNHIPAEDKRCLSESIATIENRQSPIVILEGCWNLLSGLKEYHGLHQFLEQALKIVDTPVTTSHFARLVSRMPKVQQYLELLTPLFNERGELDALNVPQLAAAYREVLRKTNECETKVKQLLLQYQSFVNNSTVVQRGGRYVLPIATDHIGKINGMVVSHSATERTSFMETEALMSYNNNLIVAQQTYQNAVNAYISSVAERMVNMQPTLPIISRYMAMVDSINACAHYARVHQCNVVTVGGEHIVLNQARHPALKEDAVPIDITLHKSAPVLIIGGANAAGKSVTLQTIALIAILSHYGMPSPVGTESMFAWCDSLDMLIGDNQSIADHRSTFSSNMEHIASMMADATTNTILLFDELAANTDPDEGAALATAMCEYCAERAIYTVVSTHYSSLKEYAFAHRHMVAKTMQYDEKHDCPTYRLVDTTYHGSHAIDVARKYGISNVITDRAVEILGSDIHRFRVQWNTLQEQKSELAARSRKLKHKERELALATERVIELQRTLRQDAEHALHKQMAQSRKKIERLVHDLTIQARQHAQAHRAVVDSKRAQVILKEMQADQQQHLTESFGDGMLQGIDTTTPPSSTAETEGGANKKINRDELTVGDYLYVPQYRRDMQIQHVLDNDRVTVSHNALKITVLLSECRPPIGSALQTVTPTNSVTVSNQSAAKPRHSIDIRGMSYIDAEQKLSLYLDRVLLHNMNNVEIVHGVGSGALQQMVKNTLHTMRHALSWEYAAPHHGGRGKTIVTMR